MTIIWLLLIKWKKKHKIFHNVFPFLLTLKIFQIPYNIISSNPYQSQYTHIFNILIPMCVTYQKIYYIICWLDFKIYEYNKYERLFELLYNTLIKQKKVKKLKKMTAKLG